MLNHAYAVILAGGRGERFWPLSTARQPKQLLSLVGKRTLIAAAVNHLKGLIPANRIFIITHADLVLPARRALPGFPHRNIIGEPFGRDTAAAITLGAAIIKARDPRAIFCVLTADHIIGDVAIFRRTLIKAFRTVTTSNCLLTIGIQPTFPSTAFGYIEVGPRLSRPGSVEIVNVRRFVEKPNRAKAARYLKTGRFFWNSGMFVWSLDAFEDALARFQPPLKKLMNRVVPVVNTPRFASVLRAEYPRLKKISVDYAIMEKADNIVMARGTFAWDDVGSWSALENHFDKDDQHNVIIGRAVSLDASGNIVVSREGLVALIGVDNLVVVRTDHATLVCPKHRAQDVKRIVELLKRKRHHDTL
ncbi:MAG: NTP transferase domain-containing protein [Verrucomicrobia bacterium]|nr:NTP transferase domain-containing protein [Verrucomicrobiota bacterium]MBU4430131.1 NTP transferase domain-containing protein [Verrucomicrobiota bacterium]MCG2680340.1 NTP transferase domain-containing protein [Kiritimatiellia bacterium]